MVDSFAAVAFPRWNFQFYSFSFKTIANSNRQIWCPFADAANKFIRLISLINSYFAFSFFSFFYDNVFAIRCMDASLADAKKSLSWEVPVGLFSYLVRALLLYRRDWWFESLTSLSYISQAFFCNCSYNCDYLVCYVEYWTRLLGEGRGTFERPVGIATRPIFKNPRSTSGYLSRGARFSAYSAVPLRVGKVRYMVNSLCNKRSMSQGKHKGKHGIFRL